MSAYARDSEGDAEVLVIGGSLAGLVAAGEAADRGVRTLLVDAAPEIGGRANPANVVMEPLWPTQKLEFPESTVRREFSGVRVAGPSGRGPMFRFRAMHLDRSAFDAHFAAKARQAGARIRSGVQVSGVSTPRDGGAGVEIQTSDGNLRAPVAIFADGADSAVQQVMTTMRNPRDVAWGLDQLLEAPGLGQSPYFHVRFGSFAPGWRAQLNPLGGDRANLWTFRRGGSKEELGALAERARKLFVGAEQAKVLDEARGADPAFVASGRIACDGVLACGAAAGQGGLENGARAGLLAGETAARAVYAGDASRGFLARYERGWRRRVVGEVLALRAGVGALRHLCDAELDAFFGELSEMEFDEREFKSVLRANAPVFVRKAGVRTGASLSLKLARAWTRAAAASVRRRHR